MALVRHPIYTGIILASFATFLMRGTVLSLAGFGTHLDPVLVPEGAAGGEFPARRTGPGGL